MRRWITFVAALLVGLAMGQLGAQTSRPSDTKVRLLGVRQGSATTPSEDLIRATSHWTDDVARVREQCLREKYYRTYPQHGRTNAERNHRLLGG